MINTAIARFYMNKRGQVSANILYPDDNALTLLHPDDNSFKNKKIYYDRADIEAFESFFNIAGFRESSLLVEATLEKYHEGLLLCCKSLLHKLNTKEFEAAYMLDDDSKKLTITVWEKKHRKKYLKCFEALTQDKKIYVATSETQCSSGIRVAKVERVQLKSRKGS